MNWISNANNCMNYDNDHKSTWALLFSNWLPVATRISDRNWLCIVCWVYLLVILLPLCFSHSLLRTFVLCAWKSVRRQSKVMSSKIPSKNVFGYVDLSNGLLLMDDVWTFDKWPKTLSQKLSWSSSQIRRDDLQRIDSECRLKQFELINRTNNTNCFGILQWNELNEFNVEAYCHNASCLLTVVLVSIEIYLVGLCTQ